MTDKIQETLLKKSVEKWNVWREKNPTIRPDLSYANLHFANLSHADLKNANLSYANLTEADLSYANLILTNLIRADLSYTNLTEADLSEADLSYANLTESDLSYAHLISTDLISTDLSHAELGGANLSHADLSGANLKETHIGNTIFANIDLRTVQELETVIHHGPSTIGTDTILRSEGNISAVFLRGAGLTDTFISYIRSLVNNPIEYYTCFISYSHHNQDFAEKLYKDLQYKGVRCWFAPEDMDIGDKIRPRIDETIRLFDKLLLVLSEHSIASNWVAYEVERALNKEPNGVPNVLYPVRLDDTILTCTTSWAQDIKDTRHIGDFTDWKNHDTYQKNFNRLLRALTQKQGNR